MKKHNLLKKFPNKIILIWMTINLVLSPLAFSIDGDADYTYNSIISGKEIVAGELFAQVTPITYPEMVIQDVIKEANQHNNPVAEDNKQASASVQKDLAQSNNSGLKYFYAIFLISIVIFYLFSLYSLNWQLGTKGQDPATIGIVIIAVAAVIGGGILISKGCAPTFEPKMEVTEAPDDEVYTEEPFNISLRLYCTDTDGSCTQEFGGKFEGECFYGDLSITVPTGWDVSMENFEISSYNRTDDGDEQTLTFTRAWCQKFSESSPTFHLTPHFANSLDPRDVATIKLSFKLSETMQVVEPPIEIDESEDIEVTVLSNDADINQALCTEDTLHWVDDVGCCGDDQGECGTLNTDDEGAYGSYFCNYDSRYSRYYWYNYKHDSNIGRTGRVDCVSPAYDVVSLGVNGLFMCDGTPPIINRSLSDCVVSLSDRVNAHLAKCGSDSGYDWSLYCQPPEGYALECEYEDAMCSVDRIDILTLSRERNAHAALSYDSSSIFIPQPPDGNNPDDIYIPGLIPVGFEDDFGGGSYYIPGLGSFTSTDVGGSDLPKICCELKKINSGGNLLEKGTGQSSSYMILSLSSSTNAHASYKYLYDPYNYAVAFSSDDENVSNIRCDLFSNKGILTAPNGLIRLSTLGGLIAADGSLATAPHEYLCGGDYGKNEIYECCAEHPHCNSPRHVELLTPVLDLDGLTYYCLSNNRWSHFCRNDPWNQPDSDYPRTDYEYCAFEGNLSEMGYGIFCSTTGLWTRTEENRTHFSNLSILPDGDSWPGIVRSAECCRQDQCWNGTGCYDQQNGNTLDPPFPNRDPEELTDGWRCIDGEWTESKIKYTWDKTEKGYCPYESQCLVNPTSTNADHGNLSALTSTDYDGWNGNDIQCVNDAQFIGDHYCEDGSWTSRTKMVAQQMLNFVESSGIEDYTLFCDRYTESLNYYTYNYYLIGNVNDKIFERDDKIINNLCVLRYNKGGTEVVWVGAALNKPINESLGRTGGTKNYTFLTLLLKNNGYCDGAIENIDDDWNYNYCGSGDVWYNNHTMAVIFSKESISMNGGIIARITDWFQRVIDYLFGLEEEIPPEISGWAFSEDVSYSFANNTQDYNRIYVDQKGAKRIMGIVEKVAINPGEGSDTDFISYLGVRYEGFDEDICDSVIQYSQKNVLVADPLSQPITCNMMPESSSEDGSQVDVYYVQTTITEEADLAPLAEPVWKGSWKGLTAKLRVPYTTD